jgi:predicted anti-sigma-YlaC factor YlaD
MADPAFLDVRCRAARVWISSAVDGEATRSELVAMRAHLADCADCRAWAALAESLALQVRTAQPAVTDDLFVPTVPEKASAPRRRLPLRALLAASGVAAALIGGIIVASAPQQGTPTATSGSTPVITVASNARGVLDGEAAFLLHATGVVHGPSAKGAHVSSLRRPVRLRNLSSAQ